MLTLNYSITSKPIAMSTHLPSPFAFLMLSLIMIDMPVFGQTAESQTSTTAAYEQTIFVPPSNAAIDTPLSEVDEMPVFPGGIDSLFRFISKNIKYPAVARENEVEGTVYVRFVIGVDGRVRNAEVLRSPDESLSKESLRVISLMPIWTPGKNKGMEVPVYYTLPMRYALE